MVTEVYAIATKLREQGREPIVVIDRTRKTEPIHARLTRALAVAGFLGKFQSLMRLAVQRYFSEAGEIEVTDYHLHGVPLFGDSRDGVKQVFASYASFYSLSPAALHVYKRNKGFLGTAIRRYHRGV